MTAKKSTGAPSKEAQAAGASAPTTEQVAALMAEVARLSNALAVATKINATPAAAVTPTVQGLPKEAPKFKEAPRYKLLEKAFMAGIKVRQGSDWVPFDDVMLDPESMPFLNKLSGPFGGLGDAEREPIMIEFLGIPDDHLEPANEAAEWMFDNIDVLKDRALAMAASRQTKRRRRDPIESLTTIGPNATVINQASQ